MLRIGLTGGIGSGKSTVAKVFETLGIPVYYADEVAKRILNSDPVLKESILLHFGTAAYKEGILDRKYLAAVVFNNQEKLDLLNSLVHPATIRDSQSWMQDQNAPYAIREAALLFESGAAGNLDFVIGVYAPRVLRIQRVIKRDGLTAEEIEKRISRQINEEMKMKLCDAVIRNDEQELVIPQVMRLHEKLLEMNRIKKSKVKKDS
ncbi:MAG: dephospho-CoA kinase [Sphingobacteriales bacterium]|nr:dephospho-CoA kinase [Sphingobacteriales bacterium]